MPWIQVRKPSPQHPDVLQAFRAAMSGYPAEYGRDRGPESRLPEAVRGDSIVEAHSLIPGALAGMFSGFRALLDPALPLSRRQHEMIATVVSELNDCFYWVESHAEFLRTITEDDALVDALRHDWRTAPIEAAERVMLEFVEKLTLRPAQMQRSDVEALHAAGFDDVAVAQITMIAAYFAYVNRVADGLGVGRA